MGRPDRDDGIPALDQPRNLLLPVPVSLIEQTLLELLERPVVGVCPGLPRENTVQLEDLAMPSGEVAVEQCRERRLLIPVAENRELQKFDLLFEPSTSRKRLCRGGRKS